MPRWTSEDLDKIIDLSYKKYEPKQTNADHIRSMTDVELTRLITSGEFCAICPCCKYYTTEDCYIENEGAQKNCEKGIMEWLQSEAEG